MVEDDEAIVHKSAAPWLATIVISCVTYYAVAVVALHVLRPEYDPVSRVTSNYAVGPYGYLMTATFFAFAAALFVLSFGLSRVLATPAQSRLGFRKRPPTTGRMHL